MGENAKVRQRGAKLETTHVRASGSKSLTSFVGSRWYGQRKCPDWLRQRIFETGADRVPRRTFAHRYAQPVSYVGRPRPRKRERRTTRALKDSGSAALGYFFDACLTCRVPAFTRDLRLTRSGITARFAAVFLARFYHAGARNMRTDLLLMCCHIFYSIPMIRTPAINTVSKGGDNDWLPM